jgi:hypothetical protein
MMGLLIESCRIVRLQIMNVVFLKCYFPVYNSDGEGLLKFSCGIFRIPNTYRSRIYSIYLVPRWGGVIILVTFHLSLGC